MSYVWGTQGIGFQYPTCYRIENRFLTLRAAVLLLGMLAVMWIALAEPEPATSAAALLTKLDRGSPLPHILVAVLLLLLGVLDLVTAARQRRVMLVPGQPASLGHELSRQGGGTSPDAEWMMKLLGQGQVPKAEPRGDYARWLRRLSDHVAQAPVGLQNYLSMRIAHLLLAGGLGLALLLTWLPLAQAPALPMAVLLYAGLAAAMAARSAWLTHGAPGPVALAVTLAVTWVAALALALFGADIPQVGRLKSLALPAATALVLGCMALIEGLALLAARAQVPGPVRTLLTKAEASADLFADPARLMHEVEREMHRFWAEGVPNRRHAWETPAAAGVRADGAEASATVLEESQPQALPERAERDDRDGSGRMQTWLLALDTLGLLLTLAGVVLWVRLAYLQMGNAATPWTPGPMAVVFIIAGGYALRAGHLLWSRFEVESLLVWVQFEPIDPHPTPLAERNLRLRARLGRLRSVFYAAADHGLGSRTLLRVVGDEATARKFVDQVRAYAERAPVEHAPVPRDRPAPPPGLAASAGFAPMHRPPAVPTAAPAPVAARGVARFCHACGTPLLPAARFCSSCGQAVVPG